MTKMKTIDQTEMEDHVTKFNHNMNQIFFLLLLNESASPILAPPPVPSHAPFNFFAFVRQSSGHTASILQSIHLLDKRLPPGPIFDHSERAGGGVRCINFFSRTWSLTQQGTSVEPCV